RGGEAAAGDHAGHDLHEVDDVPPVQRDVAELAVRHDVRALARLRLDLQPSRVRLHGDGLGDVADLEHEDAHVHLGGDGQDDVAPRHFLEPGQLGGDGVRPGRELRED